LARPETRLIDVAMITATSRNDIRACRSAVRRICLDLMSVSETWNVMPIVAWLAMDFASRRHTADHTQPQKSRARMSHPISALCRPGAECDAAGR